MANVLILYANQQGQTQTIADFIADALKDEGHSAMVSSIEVLTQLNNFDAVILGASIYRGRYPKGLKKYIQDHKKQLKLLPSAFFSVCPKYSKTDEIQQQQAQTHLDKLLAETNWHPDISSSFAAALRFSPYVFFKTKVMKAIAKREHLQADTEQDSEYGNLEKVVRFSLRFSDLLNHPLQLETKPAKALNQAK